VAACATHAGARHRPAHAVRFVYFPLVKAPNHALRVVLADDHHFFLEGLRGMLAADGMVVVGEASDGADAIALAREMAPDIVVIDLKMPRVSGVEAVREIAAASPDVHVFVLTVSADEADAIDAIAAGACGYLLKDTRADELVGAIRLAAGGHAVLSREVVRALVARVRADAHAAEQTQSDALALTTRELEVLRLIADGADNATIGRELSISKHTVKQYVTNIFEKLGVDSRVRAAVYAVRKGLT
jgi:DNA-binding NarL/FixJ family response regulator